jgi:hypothetical protein
MANRQQSLAAKSVVSSPTRMPDLSPAQPRWKMEEPWMAILFKELDRSFREFAKESGRLARLVQRKKTCCVPSEGFSHLVSERMEAVEYAFQTYLRRKDELLTYIHATAWQADHCKSRTFKAIKPRSRWEIDPHGQDVPNSR